MLILFKTQNEKNVIANVPTSVVETEGKTELNTTIQEIQTKAKKNSYKVGYVKGNNINIRKKPSKTSKIKGQIYYGKKIRYIKINSKWAKIKYSSAKGYIQIKYISNKKRQSITHDTVPNYKLHSYMSYKSLSSTTSKQYKLQKIAYTGTYGIRQVDGRFCIAMGSYYTTKIGTYIDLELSDGTVIPCVLADCKADIHTDSMNQKTSDGSLIEFVVDINCLSNKVCVMGDVSYANNKWKNKVTKIKIYKKVEKY